jgi:hypothetical protein
VRSLKKVLVLFAGVLTVFAACVSGAAAVAPDLTYQGVAGQPFTFEPLPATLELVDGEGGNQDLRLAVTAVERISSASKVYGGTTPSPRCLQVLANGNLLITDNSAKMVAEVTRAGVPVWKYDVADDPDLANESKLFSAQRFVRDGQEYTLMAARDSALVWVVDQEKRLVWQYGTAGAEGLGVNHLEDPFYARYDAASDTVLICDALHSPRVIEISYGDYRAGEPDNGFTAKSIGWSYGVPGVRGDGPGELAKPHCAQRLANGDVLITDAGDDDFAARVIEVDRDTRQIVWQYGGSGPAVVGHGDLLGTNYATRLPGGDTLLADADSGRVLRIAHDGVVVKAYDLSQVGRPSWGTGAPSPRCAAVTGDGLVAVADSVFGQIVLLGYERSAQTSSSPLDCTRPGVKKAFVRLTWKGDTGQSGTKIGVDYRLDGRSWRPCKGISGTRAYDFPAGTVGRTIAYRVTLSSTDRQHTPTLDSIIIQSMKATTGGGGGGGGGDKPGGSGNSGSSGVYKYPSTAAGGTGTYGTGTGSGSYGAGTGSGSSGAGAGRSGTGAGSSSVADSVQPPVRSSGSGAAQAVQGFQVEGEQGVSGVPLRAVEGPQAPAPGSPGPPLPVLPLIGAGLVIAAAFFVPWPFAAAQIRAVAGFDHTRPKFYRPFWPLGK